MSILNHHDEKGMTVVKPSGMRSRKDRQFLLVTAALVVTSLLAVILLAALCTKGFGAWRERVCNTRQCVRSAARIAAYMDDQIDPCHDFYLYSCGGYEKINVIAPGTGTVNPWSTLSNDLLIKVKTLLETPSKLDHLNVVKQAKNYYRSCMNETHLDKLGTKPIMEYIRSKGGWALLDPNWNEEGFDLEEYIVRVGLDSMPSLVSARVGPNLNKSHENIVHMGQSVLSLGNRDYYLKQKEIPIRQAFIRMVMKFAISLGADVEEVRPRVMEMVEFETEMARLTLPASGRQLAQAKLMRARELVQQFKGFDAMKLINGFLKPLGLSVHEDSIVGVSDEEYLRGIGSLITRTRPAVLASYILWRGVSSLIVYADKKTRELRDELRTLTRGTSVSKPRFQFCAGNTNSEFSYATARLFVDEYFRDGTDDIKDMTQHLKDVFKDNLDRLEWFDEESRKEARAKVDTMRSKLAYPSFILDDKALDEESTIDNLQPDQYFNNAVRINRENVKNTLMNLNSSVDYIKWHMPPVVVNAFYNPPGNMIVFPLGILQPPFYDINGLKVLNYAGVGEVMGHEITHGFDSNGRLFDKNGNRHQWWTPEAVQKFLVRAKCVEEQYSNITIEKIGTKVDGKLTQGENIADIGAIKQAFQAYQNWVQENGEEKSLPGLNLNSNELFFVSYAQMYCHVITPELLKMLSHDTHTPMRERVYGTLINSDHFAQTFRCPRGSRMNPGNQCSIW